MGLNLEAATIARALGGSVHGTYAMVRCPAHDDRTPSLKIASRDGGGLLVYCFAGCSFHAIRAALAERGLWPDAPARPVRLPHAPPSRPERKRMRWSPCAEAIWRRTIPIAGTQGETYLRGRHCHVPDPYDLRFGFWRGHPALVARLTDAVTADPVTLHFTLLRADGRGKAAVKPNKRFLEGHQQKSGVVRLVADAEVTLGLGLGEGLENALTAMADGWRPIWAAVNAGNLRNFPVLAGIEALTIFADPGSPGIPAAETCARRWQAAGREACVVPPPGADDWNDTIRKAS